MQAFQIMAPFTAKDEHVATERIGASDLLHLGRQAIEPGAQIDRLAGEKNLPDYAPPSAMEVTVQNKND